MRNLPRPSTRMAPFGGASDPTEIFAILPSRTITVRSSRTRSESIGITDTCENTIVVECGGRGLADNQGDNTHTNSPQTKGRVLPSMRHRRHACRNVTGWVNSQADSAGSL